MRRKPGLLVVLVVLVLVSCARPPKEVPEVQPPAQVPAAVQADWSDLVGWERDDPRPVLEGLRATCRALRWRDGWQDVCAAVSLSQPQDAGQARAFFENWFTPWKLQQEDGSDTGLLTGYYVPDIRGSRVPDERFRYPVYGVPDDLLIVDLASVYPELEGYRLRGRLDGRRVVPYWERREIDARPDLLAGHELFWVEDPVELFFLQIQGSGRVVLPDGSKVLINYADQNGHPYRSIGRLLIERGAMSREKMSMQNIRAWARKHPELVADLLGENPSYVFFRELGPKWHAPPGAMGLSLLPERSLAVDRRFVPLGVPVWLDSSWPMTDTPLRRLMLAMDTGGAIKGRVRADFFWGMGPEAGALAGRTRQPLRLWLLLPRGVLPPGVETSR